MGRAAGLGVLGGAGAWQGRICFHGLCSGPGGPGGAGAWQGCQQGQDRNWAGLCEAAPVSGRCVWGCAVGAVKQPGAFPGRPAWSPPPALKACQSDKAPVPSVTHLETGAALKLRQSPC